MMHRSVGTISRRGFVAGVSGLGLALAARPGLGADGRGGVLKISSSVRTTSVNPLQVSGPSEYLAIDMLYSGLTRLGVDMVPRPDLAISWQASPDATSYTFKLRPGVTFHDGTPFTARDVIATFKAILDPASACPARAVLKHVSDVSAPDDLTVVFKLGSADADFPVATAHCNARIVPAAAVQAGVDTLNLHANGTGPFRQDQFDNERILTLKRFDKYYVAGQPYLDGVELTLYPDLTAETSNFLSGSTDAMLAVQQSDYARIAAAPQTKGARVAAGRFVNIVMRQDQKPFDDIRVRRALAMAVDRQMLVDTVLEGLGAIAADTPISPSYHYYTPLTPPPYDPAAARKLLAEAGYPHGLKIKLICSNRPAIRSQVGIALKAMAKPAGFDIDVETMPHDTYLANVWMKGNFYVGYWGMEATEFASFSNLFTSDAAFADTAWNNKNFDALVTEARTTLDEARRAALYARAQQLMHDEVPSIIPMFQDVLSASHSWVEDWSVNPVQKTFFVERVRKTRA